jgi:flagellar biosynthesis/type III secretory pathway M-ring protein FliF/YscJ
LVIVALFDLFYFAQMRDNTSIAVFILLAFITTFFSKNMIVVLCIALVVTHILKFGVRQVSEGFAEGAEGEEEDRKEGLEDEEEEKREGLETEMKPNPKEKKEKKEKKDDKQISEEEKKEDFTEFQQIQDKILGGMKELDPLITKAEGFIEKYSHLIQQ